MVLLRQLVGKGVDILALRDKETDVGELGGSAWCRRLAEHSDIRPITAR
jgi:hypothetical protein